MYPRWIGVGNISRSLGDRNLQLNSIFLLGDSKKEVELKVATAFPNYTINEEEIIIPQTFAEFFEFDTQPKQEILDQNTKLNLTFDLLQMFESSNQEVVDILFGKQPKPGKADSNKTRGQRLLDHLNLPQDTTFFEFLEENGFQSYLENPVFKFNLEQAGITEKTLLYEVVDMALRRVKRSDFIFDKEYKVKTTFEKPDGKWQNAIAESAFLDSTKFFQIYSSKFFNRLSAVMDREMEKDKRQGKTGAIDNQEYQMAKAIFKALELGIQNTDSQEFAVTGNAKGVDSHQRYYDKQTWINENLNLWMKDNL